jgi:hypothetical protein
MQPPSMLDKVWDSLIDAGLHAFNTGVQSSLSIAALVTVCGSIFVAILAPSGENKNSQIL